MRIVLTSCGLSLLTNYLKKFNIFPNEVYEYSNSLKTDIDNEFLIKFENALNELKKDILTYSNEELKKLSAELNALVTFYNGKFQKNDIHIIFHSDTYLGEKVAEVLKYFLENKGLNAQFFKAKDLNTANIEEFQISLSDVVKELSEILIGYKNSDYEIIFNLTGGFKSVNSFLQTMASLYADKSIYIFETSDELLIIPKLPIKVDNEIFEKYLNVFRALELGIKISIPKEIPLTLVNKIDNEYILSSFGEIVWQKAKEEIYKRKLIEPISKNIIYSENFKKQFENFTPTEKYQINKTIDKLERYVNFRENLKSLRVHELSGEISKKYNLECYPFDGNDSRRLYCNKKDGKIILEAIDSHLK